MSKPTPRHSGLTDKELKNYSREMRAYLVSSLKLDPKKAKEIVRGLVRVAKDPEYSPVRI